MTQGKGDRRSRADSSRSHGRSKDPSKTSKQPASIPTPLSLIAPSPAAAGPNTPLIPLELQQLLLNIFRDAFHSLLGSGDALAVQLQGVKGALYARDFARAFARPDWLEAYAVRWSPARALAYADILARFWDGLTGAPAPHGPVKIICLGGGAAEVVALAGLLRFRCLREPASTSSGLTMAASEGELRPGVAALSPADSEASPPPPDLVVQLIDSAAWGPVVSQLSSGVKSAPLLRAGALVASFLQADVLALSRAQLADAMSGAGAGGAEAVIVTLLFTLNELYAASVAQTTRLLLDVTAVTARGSVLLVVDSPGSYSEAAIGKGDGREEGQQQQQEKRKYPMQWLLDHTLLGRAGGEDEPPRWEKALSDESRWFRLDGRLRYPIGLENIRHQVHIYRRL